MNTILKKNILIAGFVGCCLFIVSPLLNAQDRKEYKTIDQSFCTFKAFGKPWLLYLDPKDNTLEKIFFGCTDEKTKNVRQVKTSNDLKTLIPIRKTTKILDNNIQTDIIYDGWRETYVGKALEKALQNIHVLEKHTPTKNAFVDIMLHKRVPTKLVIKDSEALSSFLQHVGNDILEKKEAFILYPKPLLLIEFKEANQVITQDDLSFLNMFWELVDHQDQDAKAFFETAQKNMMDAINDSANAKTIAQPLGELTFSLIEKDANEFKGKEITASAIKGIVTAFTTGIIVKVYYDFINKKQTAEINYLKKQGVDLSNKVDELTSAIGHFVHKKTNKEKTEEVTA